MTDKLPLFAVFGEKVDVVAGLAEVVEADDVGVIE